MGEPLALRRPLRRTIAVTPARTAAVVVTGVAVLRLLAAWRLAGPALIPDEYLYTAIARSVAHGGPPTVRGGHFDFLPVLASVLTAPVWLIHDVGLAYRVAQAECVGAMTLAALPAFALARRAGLTEKSACIASILAALVPDVAFSGLLLSEPFAYPLFLACTLAGVDAVRRPTARRQAIFLLTAGALCATRLQFAFLPLAYFAAVAVTARPLRAAAVLRAHRLVWLTVSAAGVALVMVGHALVGRYAGISGFRIAPMSVAHWMGANLVLLLVAAGWVTAPGALLGLVHQLRSRDGGARAMAAMTAATTVALVGEAGIFGAGLGQLEERYTFYAAPLLVIAFLVALERGLLGGRAHALMAGGLAAVAFLLPLDEPLFHGLRGQSPALLALSAIQRHLGWEAPLGAGALLLALALAALLLARHGREWRIPVVAAALVSVLSIGCGVTLVRASGSNAQAAWRLNVAGPVSFLAFPGSTDPGDLTTALFWNPSIVRVLVLGSRGSVDGFASVPVRLTAGGRLVGDRGPIGGAVAFQAGLNAIKTHRGRSIAERGPYGVIRDAAATRIRELVAGWSRTSGYLAANGQIAAATARPGSLARQVVRLRLWGIASGVTRLRFACSSGVERTVAVGRRARNVILPLSSGGVATCRFHLVSGPIEFRQGRIASARAQIAFEAVKAAERP
jgi:hypothetical protein